MKKINQHLQKLEGQLILTGLKTEEDAYILTEQEEGLAIANAIEAKKKSLSWRFKNLMTEAELQKKIDSIYWETELNWPKILHEANANKNHKIWEHEQRDKEKQHAIEKADALKKHWTSSRMFTYLLHVSHEHYGKELINNAETLPLIKTLCFFLTADPRFETELKFDLKKGLLIRGISGLGKTYLVKCLQDNELNPVSILSMLSVTEELKSNGEAKIGKNTHVVYIDDVGTEQTPVIHYGTHIHWFKDFIEQYYSSQKQFNRLMISTNMNFQAVEDKYGFRVRSRIKDMFNIVDVTGKDLRG